MSGLPLRLFPTEAAARKAGMQLSDLGGERLATTLYVLSPEGAERPTYLLSSASRLTVAEQRWATEHHAAVTKLGRFRVGGTFMALQTRMVRGKTRAG